MVSRDENMEELIGKFLAGEASAEEAMLLEDWKSESEANRAMYSSCVKVFVAMGGIDLAEEANVARGWERVRSATVASKHIGSFIRNTWLQVAATVAVVLGIGFMVKLLVLSPRSSEMVIASGSSVTAVTLKDQTMVRVLANSSVVVEEGFGKSNRRLKLKGSAYFEVVHKEEVPFVVDAGKVFIKDIGTKFSVTSSSDEDTVFVKVDEGVVLLFDSIGSQIEIKATERAMYIKSRRQIVTPKGSQLSGGKMSFVNASLSEVIARLCESYKVTILVENSDLANCKLTTQFDNENLETILTVITETLGVTFEKRETGYIIKGEQCK